jgi:hypothetical protein
MTYCVQRFNSIKFALLPPSTRPSSAAEDDDDDDDADENVASRTASNSELKTKPAMVATPDAKKGDDAKRSRHKRRSTTGAFRRRRKRYHPFLSGGLGQGGSVGQSMASAESYMPFALDATDVEVVDINKLKVAHGRGTPEQDAMTPVGQKKKHKTFSRVPTMAAGAVGGGGAGHPTLVVLLRLPRALYEQIPPFLRCLEDGKPAIEQERARLVDVVGVLFSQGVNEMQSMANKVGKTKAQDEVNKQSVRTLQAYYQAFLRYTKKARKKQASGTASAKAFKKLGSLTLSESRIESELNQLVPMVNNAKAEKNIHILQLARSIARRMAAGRVVCCKSAKDRTSMSVTWEQSQLLQEEHKFEAENAHSAIQLMRLEGVRRCNVLKNTAKTAYAFNQFQRRLLPTVFRPPVSACGNTQS